MRSNEDKFTSLIARRKRGFLEAMPLNRTLNKLLSTPISLSNASVACMDYNQLPTSSEPHPALMTR